jgi:hypothetical protein
MGKIGFSTGSSHREKVISRDSIWLLELCGALCPYWPIYGPISSKYWGSGIGVRVGENLSKKSANIKLILPPTGRIMTSNEVKFGCFIRTEP